MTDVPAAAETISDEEIKAVVAGYRVWMEELKERIGALRKEYRGLEETIYQYVAWRRTGEEPVGPRTDGDDRMLRTVVRKERELADCRAELGEVLQGLEEQRVRIQRIFLAYMMLPLEEYRVLHALYEERIPWKRLPQHLGMSKRTVIRRRTDALSHIRARLAEPQRASGDLMAAERGGYRPRETGREESHAGRIYSGER